MTLHSKAATDEVLDMFNQTLRDVQSITEQPEGPTDSDYEDDDYTSGGESTGTGRISGTVSEYGDETEVIDSTTNVESTEAKSISEWSDFTRSKHVPKVQPGQERMQEDTEVSIPEPAVDEVRTPVSPHPPQEYDIRYVPIPPEDIVAPTHPFRDMDQRQENRLPFMTPIVEMTESSIGMPSTRQWRDYFTAKTPSRSRDH